MAQKFLQINYLIIQLLDLGFWYWTDTQDLLPKFQFIKLLNYRNYENKKRLNQPESK